MKTREQRRAAAVANRLVGFPQDACRRKAYGARAHKFGVMIRTNGLVRTLSYLAAKGGGDGTQPWAYKRFADDVAAALHGMEAWQPSGAADVVALIDELRAADLPRYMVLTRESLALADWFKRFSISILGVTDVRDVEDR